MGGGPEQTPASTRKACKLLKYSSIQRLEQERKRMEEAAGTRWDFHYWKLLCDWSKLENNKTFISSASFQFIFIALSKPSMKQYESKVRCVRHHVQSWTINHAPNKYQNLMLIAGIMFVLCTQCQWTIQLRGFNSTYTFCSLVRSRKFECYTY